MFSSQQLKSCHGSIVEKNGRSFLPLVKKGHFHLPLQISLAAFVYYE